MSTSPRIAGMAVALGLGMGSALLTTAAPSAWADSADTEAANAVRGTAHHPSAARQPGSQRSSRSKSPAAAAARASAVRTDPLTALLNNTAPRPVAVQTGQSPGGVVTGSLDGEDVDGDPVGIAVTRAPGHGTVALTPAGGYTYTADPALAHTGTVDSFDITASDAGAGFHIHGIAGLLNLLTFGLLGAAGHNTTTTVRVSAEPFNNAPTATLRIDPPDPVTGITSGRVLGADANGDTLTYTGTPAAYGSAIVTATGDFTYSPDAGAPTAGHDTFAVTVDDGYGGNLVVPVTIPLGSAAPAGELSTFCGCTLMPADTIFHADVSGLPVLAKSQTWTTLLGGTLKAGWNGAPWMGSSAGHPVNIVGPDRPTETVIFNRGTSTTGPGIDDRPYAIPDYPLVEGMPDVPAWDRHLFVLQTGTCISQELINVANGVELPAAGWADGLANAAYAALYGDAWVAEAGVHIDMNSPLYPAIGTANASRLPFLPLILRPDDLARSEIDHMLGIAIAKDRGTGYTWPARSGDGTGTNPDGVPMGTVFRLRADFDISGYDPTTQVVLRALQQHGAVVFDSGAPGGDGAGLLSMSNGWTAGDYPITQQELRTIPLSAFEAVDVLSLALDPGTSWQIRT